MKRFGSTVFAACLVAVLSHEPAAWAITRCDVIADAQSWVDAQVPYSWGPGAPTCPGDMYCDPLRGGACYRPDCSGFVSSTLALPAPGQSSYYYAGGAWDNGTTHIISPSELQPGDVLHRPGDPGVKTGHVMLYVSGNFASGWVEDYEELSCGKIAVRHWRSIDPSQYLPVRYNGIEPCQQCVAHCEGTKVFSADCGVGDCGVYGAVCVDDDLGARCAWPTCPPQGKADICVSKDLVGSCDNGAVTTGDCSLYAAFCSTAGGTPGHCVSAFCVEAAEDVPVAHDICFLDGDLYRCDDNGGLAKTGCSPGEKCSVYPTVHCTADNGCPADGDVRMCIGDVAAWCLAGGLVQADDCSASGFCSTAGGSQPHCVSSVCVSGAEEVPAERWLCLPSGQIGHCRADGSLEEQDCPTGESCDESGGSPICATPPVVDSGMADGPSLADAPAWPTDGPSAESAAAGGYAPAGEPSGCSCRVGAGPREPVGGVILWAVGCWLALGRTRRRRCYPRTKR